MKKITALLVSMLAFAAHGETFDYAKIINVKPHMVSQPDVNMVCDSNEALNVARYRIPGYTCRASYEIKPNGYQVRRGFEIQYEYNGVTYSTIGGWIPVSNKIRVVIDDHGMVRPDL